MAWRRSRRPAPGPAARRGTADAGALTARRAAAGPAPSPSRAPAQSPARGPSPARARRLPRAPSRRRARTGMGEAAATTPRPSSCRRPRSSRWPTLPRRRPGTRCRLSSVSSTRLTTSGFTRLCKLIIFFFSKRCTSVPMCIPWTMDMHWKMSLTINWILFAWLKDFELPLSRNTRLYHRLQMWI